ncbi:hypothetical protein D3C83_281300 [compost metagenome]
MTLRASGEGAVSVAASQVLGGPNRMMRWSPASTIKGLLSGAMMMPPSALDIDDEHVGVNATTV